MTEMVNHKTPWNDSPKQLPYDTMCARISGIGPTSPKIHMTVSSSLDSTSPEPTTRHWFWFNSVEQSLGQV